MARRRFPRVNPGEGVIVVQARWTDTDLAGQLIASGDWEVVCPQCQRPAPPSGLHGARSSSSGSSSSPGVRVAISFIHFPLATGNGFHRPGESVLGPA